MGEPTVQVRKQVNARPETVRRVLADYRTHHPKILPPRYFKRLEVLAGGVGAGTRTQVEMKILGTTTVFTQIVSEPEPAQMPTWVLVESNEDGSAVTRFVVTADFRSRYPDEGAAPPRGIDPVQPYIIVEPDYQARRCSVTIETELRRQPGLVGAIRHWLTAFALRTIYREELELLDAYVARMA